MCGSASVRSFFRLAVSAAAAAAADEANKTGWTDSAEFSLVATDGNAESSSVGFKNTALRTWDRSTLKIHVGGIRVETQEGDRFAEDDGAGGFDVVDPDTEVSSEAYTATGRFDRKFSEAFFWYTGTSWYRNEPSGIQNRHIAEGGVGNVWFDGDDVKFKTNYGVTYTKQEDVDEDPTVDETFAGARVSWDYSNKLTETTTYTNVFILDDNLEETSDWRADMLQGLSVSINSHMALKVGLRLLYDNEPALEALKLFDLGGVDTDTTVDVPLDELDTIVTASLVVNFD